LENEISEARLVEEWRDEYMRTITYENDIFIDGKIEGRAQEIIELGQEFNLSDDEILGRLQSRLNITKEAALKYVEKFSNVLV